MGGEERGKKAFASLLVLVFYRKQVAVRNSALEEMLKESSKLVRGMALSH